jgi:hypothetical protein
MSVEMTGRHSLSVVLTRRAAIVIGGVRAR